MEWKVGNSQHKLNKMTRLELAAKRKRIQVEVARRELVEAQLVQDEEKEQVTKAAVKRARQQDTLRPISKNRCKLFNIVII